MALEALKGLDMKGMLVKAEENDRRIKNIEATVIQNNIMLKELLKERKESSTNP